MSKTLWRKTIITGTQCLVPACRDAEEWLAKTKLSQGVMIEPRRPRNLQHHKKLFALLNLAVDNWPREDAITVDGLLGMLKITAGHFEPVQTRDGIVKIPKSINFESMDQTGFDPFYAHCAAVLSKILGVDVETLTQEAA